MRRQRNKFIFLIFSVVIWISSCGTNKLVTERHPNIILIMADDQGYGDLGVMGNPILETPNIDTMAARSATMTNFYVSPVCAPTRASLMTGRYNYRTGVIDTYVSRAMMHTDEVTIAEILRKEGYTTGIFGKWHLGDCYPMRAMDQGFDEALVLKGGGLAQPSEPFENKRRYTDPVLFHNGQMVQTSGYCTDVYFRYATRFIKKNVEVKKPFFVYLPTNAPHGPFHDVPGELFDYYSKKDLSSVSYEKKPDLDRLAAIFAMIGNIDQNIGRLFATIEQLGIQEETIVIFLTDNGPNTRRYVGKLRGMKGEVLEGGIRAPFYIYWPSVFKGGEMSDVRVAHYDLMPTLLDAAGVQLPEGLDIDGRSFLPLLKGEKIPWPERNLFLQWHRGEEPHRYKHFAMVGKKWELLSQDSARFELYDLENDPGERHEIADEHPDIVENMKIKYMAWFNDVSSTRDNNYAKPRIVIGSDAEVETVLTSQDWLRTAGSGWGKRGKWLLTVDGPATFDVTIRLSEPKPGWHGTIKIGDIIFEKEFGPNDDKITFESIHLNAGDIDIEATVSKGDEIESWLHVIVRKI